MGEGGRRPGEGSFFDREKHFNSITFADKEPSPALSGTLSHPGGRERGKIGDSSTISTILICDFPPRKGEGKYDVQCRWSCCLCATTWARKYVHLIARKGLGQCDLL